MNVFSHRYLLEQLQRQNFVAFLKGAVPIVSSAIDLKWGWYLDAMASYLMTVADGRSERMIVTLPPRYLKSICASVALVAFILGRDPSKRIICISYSAELARKHAEDTRRLMRSAWYRRLFPGTKIEKDTIFDIETTLGGGRFATSTGGTLTGRGGDLLIIDDPVKAQDAYSEAMRNSTYEWFATTAFTRLNDKAKGGIIVVMQRLHVDDLAGRLLATGEWEQLYLQAIAEERTRIWLGEKKWHQREIGDVLHPEREPLKVLEGIRATLGSLVFAAQYQQEPVQVDGNLIKWSWFMTYDRAPDILPGDEIVIAWDTAASESTLADYSVGIVLLVRGEQIYVLDLIRERLGFPQLKARVAALHYRWKNLASRYRLLIEHTSSGFSLGQELRAQGIAVISVPVTTDKIARMNGPSARIEGGAVWLPKEATWLPEFKREVLAFPAGKHDDQVDALSLALNHIATVRSRAIRYGFVRGGY